MQAAPTYAASVQGAIAIGDWRRYGKDSSAAPGAGGDVPQRAQRGGVELQAAFIRITVMRDSFQEGHSKLCAQHGQMRLGLQKRCTGDRDGRADEVLHEKVSAQEVSFGWLVTHGV